MNRIILGLAIGIAVCAPVAAAYLQPDRKGTRIIAGIVNPSGGIVYGHGFSVSHTNVGEYAITVPAMTGCAAATVTSATFANVASVQVECNGRFLVAIANPEGQGSNAEFNFIIYQ